MKRKILSCLTALAVGLSLAAVIFAQKDDRRVASAAGDLYIISAKAGGVNYIEGKVAVARNGARSRYLVKGDQLEIGDKVSTGTNGKAEILLNPGSYVRLGENTVFEFVSTLLDDVEIKLTSGSAVLEVFADDEFKVAISTPKANFYAVKTGVYRVDVLADGSGKISVWKGKAQIGANDEAVVKGGKAAIVNNTQVAVEKFDRDEKDALEAWSKERAKELAKINSKLERNNVRNTLINSFNSRRWGLYDSFGLWVYDRFSGYYCFVPFGYGWNSPYGYGFNRDIWYFRMPRYIYTQPPPVNNNSNNNGSNPTDSGLTRRVIVKSPPFERVQPTMDRRSTIKASDDIPMSTPIPTSRPVVVPAPAAVPRSSSKGKPD